MKNKSEEDLLNRYLLDMASPEEKMMVESWYLQAADDGPAPSAAVLFAAKERVLNQLELAHVKGNQLKRWVKLSAAAVLLICGSVVFYNWGHSDSGSSTQYAVDFKAGGDKAVLTLGDGRQVLLNDSANPRLSGESALHIAKADAGALVYASGESVSGADQYNTVQTPVGGQYRLSLPDGTLVWLNASSSLRFLNHFSDDRPREVELKGEAYFEVAARYRGNGKHERLAFHVLSGTQKVAVLGTHFNVSSYTEDGLIRTTLLEGVVQVARLDRRERSGLSQGGAGAPPAVSSQVTVLKPGEQALFGPEKIKVVTVDPEVAVSWKKGYFRFEQESLSEIMPKLSRWYGMEVGYEQESLKHQLFSGYISRSKPLSEVLDQLENSSALRFKIVGGMVVVSRR